MTKRMLIDGLHPEETRVVIADNSYIHELDFVSSAKKQLKGNIYLAKITRVEPSLQAAFVEYGGGKQGFLPFAEIHPDYYQIPMADRQRLLEEAEHDTEDDKEDMAPEASSEAHEQENEAKDASWEEPAASEGDQGSDAPLPSFLEQSAPEDAAELPEAELPEEEKPIEGEVKENIYRAEPAEQPALRSDIIDMPPEDSTSLPAPIDTTAPAEATAASEESTAKADEEIETVSGEELESRPRRLYTRRYRIQEVIKRGQIVLVQVIKEERGNKGVSLTTFLSLAGRYCVLMPNSPKDGGISRKIMNGDDRRRLKQISAELKVSAGMSAIIRTAGMDRSRAEIKRDYDYLVKLWNRIREKTLVSTAPALIYEESDIVMRSVRDLYASDIDEVLVEGDAAYETAKEFMKTILPSHAPRVKQYKDSLPIFYAYNIEDQLLSMHDPLVRLRSGGYIVINPTEALISIDVNSGRSTGERNIEETATKTNLEAAAEIARQLRLRDLAGLIVIDFIDMYDSRNRRSVERALKDALKQDRAKIQIGRISPFGLLEMSRQRLRPSISETNMITCPHCQGRGVVRSNESLGIQILRALEKEAGSGISEIKLLVPSAVAAYLFNKQRQAISMMESRYEITVHIGVDDSLPGGGFKLEKVKGSARGRRGRGRDREQANEAKPEGVISPMTEAENLEVPLEAEEMQPEADPVGGWDDVTPRQSQSQQPRRGRRRGRRGGRDRNERFTAGESRAPEDISSEPAFVESQPGEPTAPRERNGERGERGGRRRGRRGRGKRDWQDRPHSERNQNRNVTAAGSDFSGSSQPGNEQRPAPFQPVVSPPAYSEPSHAYAENSNPAPSPSAEESAAKSSRRGWWRRIVE